MARIAKPRRRLRGEGSVYEKTRTWRTKDGQTKTKKYWVAVTAENRTTAKGKRSGSSRRFFTGATAAEAREDRDKWLREHGKPVPREANTKPISVEEFSKVFLANRKTANKYATYRDYENTLRLHILPYIGDLLLADLTAEQVKALYETLQSEVSPSMRRRVHVTLRAMLNYAIESGAIKASPLATMKKAAPKLVKSRIQPLEEAQVARLLQAAKGDRLEALFILALECGARQGELFALRWTDIDLQRGIVSIRRSASETPEGVNDDDYTKTGKERSLPISKETLEALKERKRLAKTEGLSGDYDLVFPSVEGHVLRKSNFTRRTWIPLRKAAGIPNARFHDLRHTCATMMCRENCGPKVIQERLGHASITQTMDTYVAWLPTMQAGAAKALGRTLGRLSRQKGRKAA